jgi:hypothetical protein
MYKFKENKLTLQEVTPKVEPSSLVEDDNPSDDILDSAFGE